MNKNKYMGILRLIRKKAFKLSTLGVSLVGLLVSSGISFAKYIDSNYGGGNAGTAKFGSWHVFSNTTAIEVPDNAPNGYYAFLSTFEINFTESEVNRTFTLKIKNVAASEDYSDFDNAKAHSSSKFYLDSNSSVHTITSTGSEGNVTYSYVENNVEALLMDNSKLTFSANNIYMKREEIHGSSATGSPWKAYSVNDSIYDKDTDSLILANDHFISTNIFNSHRYYIIYFVKIEKSKELDDVKFIYSLDVGQVTYNEEN
jgi:hypothetical protein